MMASPFKPARISGQIPAGYTGPIFYRMSNMQKPMSKVLADFLRYPGRDVKSVSKIVSLSSRDALIDTSDFGSYLDKDGHVDKEWSKPIHAVTKANFREDWPEFSVYHLAFISERVKNIFEKYEKDNHAYVTMDVESAEGKQLFRAFVMVRGVAIDAVDYIASGIVPAKVYPSGKASWVASIALPRDEFCYLSLEKIRNRHHFWDEKLQNVFSQDIVNELGDVLPKEFVFVPMGVVD